ncbi:MAG: NUDIX domain-containing protein [Ktedonobacteraceae bacterium]
MVASSHYVATGYVYDRHADRFLLLLHKKLGKWLPPGGHLIEGEEPHKGVIRELFEETGVPGRIIDLLDPPNVGSQATAQLPSPFCILRERISSDIESEEHIHIDFVYVVEINLTEPLDLCSEEVSHAKWVSSENMHLMDTFENVKLVCRAISSLSQGT